MIFTASTTREEKVLEESEKSRFWTAYGCPRAGALIMAASPPPRQQLRLQRAGGGR